MINALKNTPITHVVDIIMIIGICLIAILALLKIMHIGNGWTREFITTVIIFVELLLIVIRCTTPKYYVMSQILQVTAVKDILTGISIIIGFILFLILAFSVIHIFIKFSDWIGSD